MTEDELMTEEDLMTEGKNRHYQKIRREFIDEQKIARAIEWSIYVMLAASGICWFWFHDL